MQRFLQVVISLGLLVAVQGQCTQKTLNYAYSLSSFYQQLKFIAPTNAAFSFQNTNNPQLSIVITGGPSLSVSMSNSSNSQTFTETVTVTVADYDATPPSPSSASRTTGSSLTGAVLATAFGLSFFSPTISSLLLGSHFAAPVHAACTATVTIYVPSSLTVHMDLTNANVVSPSCPSGMVYQTNSGCAYWQSTFDLAWSSSANPSACAANVPSTVTATSTAGNYLAIRTSDTVAPVYVSSTVEYFSFATTLNNGQPANVTVYSTFDNNRFVAVNIVSGSMRCAVAYVCSQGSCMAATVGSLCAEKVLNPKTPNCTQSFPPPPHLATCPAVRCVNYCNAATTSASCSAQQCPSTDSDCSTTGTCSCPGAISVANTIAPSAALLAAMLILRMLSLLL